MCFTYIDKIWVKTLPHHMSGTFTTHRHAKIITAAVEVISNFHIIHVLKVFYLNSQYSLTAGHLNIKWILTFNDKHHSTHQNVCRLEYTVWEWDLTREADFDKCSHWQEQRKTIHDHYYVIWTQNLLKLLSVHSQSPNCSTKWPKPLQIYTCIQLQTT